jgi:hypothetical protein
MVPQVALSAVAFYLSKGISKDVAVGIVAVLYAGESKLNTGSQGAQSTETPGALNPSGAYGIASWNGDRQEKLKAYAQAKSLPVASLDTQLGFVLTESANSYPKVWAAIRQAGITYASFIPIFVEAYEVPANSPAEIARAIAFAEELYPAVTTAPAPAVPAPQPVQAPSPLPATPTGATLDPATVAIILAIAQAFAPSLEAAFAGLAAGVLKAALTHAPAPNTPATPPAFPGTLEDFVAEILKQLQAPKAAS